MKKQYLPDSETPQNDFCQLEWLGLAIAAARDSVEPKTPRPERRVPELKVLD